MVLSKGQAPGLRSRQAGAKEHWRRQAAPIGRQRKALAMGTSVDMRRG